MLENYNKINKKYIDNTTLVNHIHETLFQLMYIIDLRKVNKILHCSWQIQWKQEEHKFV